MRINNYTAAGLRTSKINGDIYTHYIWAGDNLIGETRGTEVQIPEELAFEMGPRTVITYLYGTNGITGFTLAGTPYYYRKNLQGDVTHILQTNGNIVASYSYDAWGNHEVTCFSSSGAVIASGATQSHVGNINPIRYRSYYYDTETGLYYLKSRYYDPETGRFINMDSPDYMEPGIVNGLNLYVCK